MASTTARAGKAIGLTYTEGWAGLYIHHEPISTSGATAVRFWANGGSAGGQKIRLCGDAKCNQSSDEITLAANTWQQVDVPLAKLGVTSTLSDLIWQNLTSGTQTQLFLDDIALVGAGAAGAAKDAPATAAEGSATPAGEGPTLLVDANIQRHPISDLIYGINFPNDQLAKNIQPTIQRWGGNATTRYNWKLDVSNRASDWFFENIPNDVADVAALPKGSSSDSFVSKAKDNGAQVIMTVPMMGWTPKSRDVLCGFAVAKYGAQQQADDQRGCGNGLKADGTPITGNDPADTSEKIGADFVKEWIAHLKGQFGAADQGGVAFYNLDNEPFLWHKTHRDIHPEPVTYDELRDLTYTYGAAVKQADPAAKTLGPAEWGWTGYFYSAKDAAGEGSWWNSKPDRSAHGDTPFVAWYLQQMKDYEAQHGTRILDYLDLHFYPQAEGVALQGAGSEATQALRLRSTRALWDANYKDESWIAEPVNLIPRMRAWVDENYPGTKLAISEYNWGALDTMNGALAQADILGIFGREALDLATLWGPPDPGEPGEFAFRIYRNYDGGGATFGDTSIFASSDDPDKLAVYAAERASDKVVTLVVINKTGGDLSTTLKLQNVDAKQAKVYRYSQADLTKIVAGEALPISAGAISASFPASSITLLELGR
ncbi:hypothetical protein F8S13_08590 [Chloroflexia bacterium SDU3-3]|nr:hypothetical protein F8S13_08590 [Chloroflexia bacterium SDU3-3]